ncbi:hypothetical protein VTO42DRAFT_8143 [Malbranchea cinnamomea]
MRQDFYKLMRDAYFSNPSPVTSSLFVLFASSVAPLFLFSPHCRASSIPMHNWCHISIWSFDTAHLNGRTSDHGIKLAASGQYPPLSYVGNLFDRPLKSSLLVSSAQRLSTTKKDAGRCAAKSVARLIHHDNSMCDFG